MVLVVKLVVKQHKGNAMRCWCCWFSFSWCDVMSSTVRGADDDE